VPNFVRTSCTEIIKAVPIAFWSRDSFLFWPIYRSSLANAAFNFDLLGCFLLDSRWVGVAHKHKINPKTRPKHWAGIGPKQNKGKKWRNNNCRTIESRVEQHKTEFFAIKATHCVYAMCHLNANMHIWSIEYGISDR